jgi:UDP-N-acetylmuramoyl-tripeptide--D-alanyl-D-alanine ligase
MTIELREIARVIGAAEPAHSFPVSSWSIDSRTVEPGALFFALRGERHDGHAFVADVLAKGAAAAVVEEAWDTNGQILRVRDSLEALQKLAGWARADWGGRVIAVTGSAGKTTTKDVIAGLLATAMPVGKTIGNFNNHVGLPLSILRLPQEPRVAVLELGMNHAGEIRDLAKIARPEIAVVTNVGFAHIENFESVEGVAAAKRELVEALPPDGIAVLNADDARVAAFASAHSGRTVTFGTSEAAEVRAERMEYSLDGVQFAVEGVVFRSSLTGRHSVLNLLAGIAIARLFGVGLERLPEAVLPLKPGRMRGERFTHAGITIWNDCYNANPEAMRAMLDVLQTTPARRRIAVLGEMLELGRWAELLHRDVGRYAAESGVTVLVGIRGAARHMVQEAMQAGLAADAAYFFEDPVPAGDLLREIAREGDAILFKGSRGTHVEMALERFLA